MNQFQTKEEILEEMERTKWKRIGLTILKDWRLYVLLLPTIVFFFLFRYMPMAGLFISFKEQPSDVLTGRTVDILFNYDWQGLRYAKNVIFGVQAPRFWAAFRNTFVISMYGLCFTFPVPILLALFFSEIKSEFWRSAVQVCAYLPKFISTVVCTTLILKLLDGGQTTGGTPGVIVRMLNALHIVPETVNTVPGNGAASGGMMTYPQYFRAIYSISGVWEGSGYGSIVYFAAIMGISPTGYEAAKIDGANKMAQIRYVTLPGMAPTLTIMLILRIGQVLNVGYEQVLLLTEGKGIYSQAQGALGSWSTAEVLSLYVYRIGMQGGSGAAVDGVQMGAVADLFNAVIAMCLVLGANFISRRVSSTALF